MDLNFSVSLILLFLICRFLRRSVEIIVSELQKLYAEVLFFLIYFNCFAFLYKQVKIKADG